MMSKHAFAYFMRLHIAAWKELSQSGGKQQVYLQAVQNSLEGVLADAPTLLGYSPAELLHEYVYRAANDNLPMIVTDHSGESGGYWVGSTQALYSVLFSRWGLDDEEEDED